MDAYAKMLRFFDYSIQTANQAALDAKGLKAKLVLVKECKRLEEARNTLRLQFHHYKDWLSIIRE